MKQSDLQKNKPEVTKKETAIGCLILFVLVLLVWGGCSMCSNDDDRYKVVSVNVDKSEIRAFLTEKITDTNKLKEIAEDIYYENKIDILVERPDVGDISVILFTSKESAAIGGLSTTFLAKYMVKQFNANKIFWVNQPLLNTLNGSSINLSECQKMNKYFKEKSITMCGYLSAINEISLKLIREEDRTKINKMTQDELFRDMDIRDSLFGLEVRKLNEKYSIDSVKSQLSRILEFDCGCIDYEF